MNIFLMRFALASLMAWGYLTIAAQQNQAEWVLLSEEEGISLSTRDNPESPINEAKAETILTGNIDSALSVLMDLDKFASTDPYVIRAEVLEVKDSNDVYYYLVSDMPMLMKSRDYVIRMRKSKTAQGYFLVYEAMEGIKPSAEGYKRVTNVTSYISLQAQPTPNSFKMIYKVVFGPEDGLSENSLLTKTANKMIPQSTADRLRALRKLLLNANIAGE